MMCLVQDRLRRNPLGFCDGGHTRNVGHRTVGYQQYWHNSATQKAANWLWSCSMNVKNDKPTAIPRFHDEQLASIAERSEVNIRTSKELLVDSRRTLEQAKKLRTLAKKLK